MFEQALVIGRGGSGPEIGSVAVDVTGVGKEGVCGGGLDRVRGVRGDEINREGGGDGDLNLVGGDGDKGGDGEGGGGVPGREIVAGLPAASLSLNKSFSQRRFLVHLAGGGLTQVGQSTGGGAWRRLDGGG